MTQFLLRRAGRLIVVLLAVTAFTSLLVSLVPGRLDRVLYPYDPSHPAVAERQAEIRAELHLDDPVWVRYGHWLADLARGDLGEIYGQSGTDPVRDQVTAALPVSLELMLYAQLLALAVAVPLGVWSAHRAGTLVDRVTSTGAFALLALPSFVVAMVLTYVFGVRLGWVRPSGWVPIGRDAAAHFRQLVLPTVSLAAGQVAVYLRLLRSDMIATLQEDFITTARAKGIPPRRVLWRHALRPSSITLLTVAGLNVGTLIGGAVIIEVLFDIPGMGTEIFAAIRQRQYVAIQSYVAVVAVLYVLVNFAVDLLYSVLDPRIRTEVTRG
jgi:peptide/nickel transport system permease protein